MYHFAALLVIIALFAIYCAHFLQRYILSDSNPAHVIQFSNLIDLRVIHIKKPMILCAPSKSRSSKQSTKRRSRSKDVRKVCNQNNKIVQLSNMGDTFFEKFRRCAKVYGFFFLIVLSGCWLAHGQTPFMDMNCSNRGLRRLQLSNMLL